MRKDNLKMQRVFQGNRTDVFNYFTDPVLLEQWSYPDGMSLKVPFMEKRVGGSYRYEHKTDKGGTFVCEGKFLEFKNNETLVTEDEVYNPEGEKVMYGLQSEITFSDDPRGCLVEIEVNGFNNPKEIADCRVGWTQCMDRLDSIFSPTTSASL